MARVRRRRLSLLLVLPLALALSCGDGASSVPDRGTQAAPLPVRWGTTEFGDLRIALPEFFRDKWVRHETEVHYLGPEVAGFRVQFQVIWMPSDMPFERWVDIRVSKVRGDPFTEMLGEGSASVGPWPAHTAVFRWKDNRGDPVTNVDYYFTGAGHVGMLRGIAPTSSFLDYRPVFDAMAARLAYRPSGSSER